MLRALHLTNWKSFGAPTEIPLSQLTLLVGPNGSGKSNVLDAVRFLQGTALGYPAEEVLRGTTEPHGRGWPGVRGGEAETLRAGARELAVGVSFTSPVLTDHVGTFAVHLKASQPVDPFETSMS